MAVSRSNIIDIDARHRLASRAHARADCFVLSMLNNGKIPYTLKGIDLVRSELHGPAQRRGNLPRAA
jgi:hypothetical protein